MLRQSLDVSVGKSLVQETGGPSDDLGQVFLHFFIGQEENILLISSPPVFQNMGEERRVVAGHITDKRIEENFEGSWNLLFRNTIQFD